MKYINHYLFLTATLTACSSGSDEPGETENGAQNTAPIVENQSFTMESSQVLVESLSVVDKDSDPLTYEILTQPVFGQVSINEAGAFEYRANANENGDVFFDFIALDAVLESNIGRVSITVRPPLPENASALDQQLTNMIVQQNIVADAAANRDIPSIADPLAQLGRTLFFSKSLGGDFDSACVSCHHPSLGGADGLSLSIGVGALNPDLLGPGRQTVDGLPNVPRNAPTVFNVALWDKGLFHDSRVESLEPRPATNGEGTSIRTPDTSFGEVDANAGENLTAAQAKFPVTSVDEMRGSTFEAGQSNDAVRQHLAARLGDYGAGANEISNNQWLEQFQAAFSSSAGAEELITFDRIALAIAEYERSLTFTDTPWKRYVEGDLVAISEAQKRGAMLFFTPTEQGGAGCSSCHSGPAFTDESHHTVAFPQWGPGKGDGNNDDFGRERESGDTGDRYRFRTPSLLNITTTAPYGHAGSFQRLEQVIDHYNNPAQSVERFIEQDLGCSLPQFSGTINCDTLYPDAAANSRLALEKLQAERNEGLSLFGNMRLNPTQRRDLLAFLEALTDPCVEDRDCLAPWIPEAGSSSLDEHQINGVNGAGNSL